MTLVSDDEHHDIETLPDDLNVVTEALEKQFGTPSASRLDWKALVKPISAIWKPHRNFWILLMRWKTTMMFRKFIIMPRLQMMSGLN